MSENNVQLTVDAVVLRVASGRYEVLLIKRGWPPYEGCWALPGGYVDPGERCCDAAVRELGEETGITLTGDLTLVGVYDDPARDPRGRVVSVAFMGQLGSGGPAPVAGDDAAAAVWVDLAEAKGLAFDHHLILEDALRVLG